MSNTKRVAVIPGDGIGPEVTSATRRILEAAGALIRVWGSQRVGVRLSPSGRSAEFTDSTPWAR